MIKDYTIVTDELSLAKLYAHLEEHEFFAFDTETTGLNTRRDKVIGLSVSGKIGKAFYVPLFSWNKTFHCLRPVFVTEAEFLKILVKLKAKELLTWNGSFDVRITKSNFGIDLTDSLMADVMLMKHTVQEEGDFRLKETAIELAEELGLGDAETAANEEQLRLKENVIANGGVWLKSNKEMYKADLEVMGPYACFAPKSAHVTLSDGSCKFIEDVQVGDVVISHTGNRRKVYDILNQHYCGSIYDLEFEVGRKISNVTSYHPFLVLNQTTLIEEWKKAEDIRENDLLVRPNFNIDKSNDIDETNDSDFWWLFGLYQAEGYIRVQGNTRYLVFTVHQNEADFVSGVLNRKDLKFSVVKKKGSKACDITVTSTVLGKRFLDLSGGKFKCHEKKISEDCFAHLINSKEDCLAFLSGIFDGDACYRYKGKTHNYCLSITSPSLINTVDMLLTNLRINSTRGSYEPSKTSKGRIVARKRRYAITVFSNECEFLFKYSQFKKFEKNNEYNLSFKKYVRVSRIKKHHYEGPVHNIEVEVDHSYIANGIISHNCADADLTLRIADYYRQNLEDEGLEEFFFDKEVMPLYKLVTIPMEDHGVKLDMPLILATKEAIIKDMAQLEERILMQLDALEEVQEWKKRKAAEMYPPKNTGAFAQEVCRNQGMELPLTQSGKYSLSAKYIEKHYNCIGKTFLQTGTGLTQEEIEHISWCLFVENDHHKININSKLQLGQIVFNCLGIKPLSKTPKGVPQFDDDLIQHLVDVHKLDWASDLSNYNKLVKISSTYIDRFLEAQEDGYYYFSYKQHGTISGRYSGDAQQMPRPKEEEELDPVVLKYNNLVRSFFIADEGRVFIDDDYESLEPHTFAHVSGDEKIRDIFRMGHDFYSTIAIVMENIQGVSADKKAPNYLGKVDKPRRQAAKPPSLGIPYGMEAYALGKTLGISTAEAQKKIDGYRGGFPSLSNWMDTSEEFVKEHGFIKTEAGRIRHLPRVREIYKKHGDSLLDWRYRNDLIIKLARKMPIPFNEAKQEAKKLVTNMYRDYKNGLNNAKNFQIQGLAASIVNAACIAIAKEFKKRGIDGYVCAQIHDQAIFNVAKSQVEEAKKIIQELMENTTKLSIPLKAPPSVAMNWKEGH